jgi:adenylate cyclase
MFSASRSGLVLSDLSSMNGTFHNGRKCSTPVNLVTGDEVRIGHVKIHVDLHMGGVEEDSVSHLQTQATAMRAVMVTVLVADVAAFTKMSQKLPPKDVADMLDAWFGEVTDIVRNEDGEIDKYIGDCVMALWRGSADDGPKGAAASIRASQEILALTDRMSSERWIHHSEYPWRCRVSLNTGEALIGSIGGKGARDFTVLGDTVNVAFRLEGIGAVKGWDLTVSAGTAELVQDLFPLKCMGPVIVEGRSDPVEVYTLE